MDVVDRAIALLTPTLLDKTPINAGISMPPNEAPTTMSPPAVPLYWLNVRVQNAMSSGHIADILSPNIKNMITLVTACSSN